MEKISISKHAVERYRERAEKDDLRKTRTTASIRKIIKDAILASEDWKPLEELMSCGTLKEYELNIKLMDEWDFIGSHKAVMTPSNKKKNYMVVTFV